MTTRRAVRVVLIDPGGKTLLLRGWDPTDPAGGAWWHVPGGGIEAGESPQAAARREMAEETGVELRDLGPVVWRRHSQFVLLGRPVEQHEVFFVVQVDAFEPDVSGWTDAERRWMTGWRWWTPDQLARTEETVYPRDLAALVISWRRQGPPPRPLTIT